MNQDTRFIFVRGMIQGLASKYNVEQEDLDMLLENYDGLNPEAVESLKKEGIA